MSNPIRYTSRTFTTILNDINSDSNLVDKPDWWKKIWSGIGDMLSMYINATANQSFLRTGFTRQAIIDLCKLIDYELSGRSTSSGVLIFHLDGATVFPKAVAQSDIKGQSEGTLSISSKLFESRAAQTVAATNEAFTVSTGDDWLIVARVYTTGEKVRVTTTNTLPAPLAINTDYYVIYVDATHIRLATSLLNAYAGTYIDITTVGVGVHTVHLYSFQATCYQQESLENSIIIGVSDGSSEWQEFNLAHKYILEDTVELTINSQTWTKVDTFVNSISTDRHFRMMYKSDGNSSIVFGNGTYGAIPGAFDIYADYAYGGGIDSNISIQNKINIYAGGDSDINSVTNQGTFTGGGNEESITNAKNIAPLLLKARDRFVTIEDGEALSLAYAGVSRAAVNPNVYGVLSCQVVIVPDGGGTPSSALKTALDTYLTERTVFGSIDVRVVDPSYSTVNVTSAMNVKSGYVFSDVLPYYTLAVRLLFSEVTNEIIEDYLENGITSAITYINSKWSTSFGTSDHAQIQAILDALTDTGMIPDFGQTYQESDVLGFIDNYVFGCNYITWTLPALPLTLDNDEIATDGVMTLTEIP